ncbi:hypothetical protein BHE74_00056920 [Ensete ventricosum]|nr:hypothetical protein BHE74_00056920 [Ensete ventricosum]
MELLSYHIHLILSGDECFVAAGSHGADIRWCYPLNSKSARHREGCCADTHRTCRNGRDPHRSRAAPALTGRRRHVVGIHICLSSRSHLLRISTLDNNL